MSKVIELCKGEVEQVSGGVSFSNTFSNIGYELGGYVDTAVDFIGENINDLINCKELQQTLMGEVVTTVLVAAILVGPGFIDRNIDDYYAGNFDFYTC